MTQLKAFFTYLKATLLDKEFNPASILIAVPVVFAALFVLDYFLAQSVFDPTLSVSFGDVGFSLGPFVGSLVFAIVSTTLVEALWAVVAHVSSFFGG